MQIVNETDEKIVIEPGEAIKADVTTHSFDGTYYRLTIDRPHEGQIPVGELGGLNEFIE